MKKKTHEEYVAELAVKNPNIEVIGKYITEKIKIKHHCLIHDTYWDFKPSSALQGCGCYLCKKEKFNQSKTKTHEQYVNEVKKISPHIKVIEKYIDAKTAIKHYCEKHDVYWSPLPTNVLKGNGCTECGKEKIRDKNRRTHDEYIKELKKVNSNIICLEKYVNANTPILHKCKIDGYEWSVSPSNLLSGHGCPKCNDSKGEKRVSLWLDNHHILYEKQKRFKDCRDIKPLPFDFYLPKQNVCIEYDGEQHFKTIKHFGGDKALEFTVKHDRIKNEYCKNNGISLLRIPYFKNIEGELNNFLFI